VSDWDYNYDEGFCPRCNGPKDLYWYCSEGYCQDCCEETDEGDDDDYDS
jgi:hypothetical protein